MNRLLLLVACLAAGTALGVAGKWLTGSDWSYLCIPLVLAGAWLFVAHPEQCAPPAPSSRAMGRDRGSDAA